MQHNVCYIGSHRAEYGDHDDRKPVDPNYISTYRKLQYQCNNQANTPEQDRHVRVDVEN
jgi:hypothetical protein